MEITEIAKEKREQEKEDKIQNLKIAVKRFEKNSSKRDLLFFQNLCSVFLYSSLNIVLQVHTKN